jgi:hypothetical protein
MLDGQEGEIVTETRKRHDLTVLSAEGGEDSVPVEETEFWKQMDRHHIGNLLAGARLNPDTGEVEGMEVVSFSTRLLQTDLFELPVSADLLRAGTEGR